MSVDGASVRQNVDILLAVAEREASWPINKIVSAGSNV